MIRIVLFIAMLLLAPVQSWAALSKSFLGSASDDSSGTALTITGVDTTGCTHVVMYGKHEGATTTSSGSDNKGSGAYSGLTIENHTNGDLSGRMFWVKLGTPGTSTDITMTLGASRPYRRTEAWCVTSGTGDLALDVEAFAEGATSPIDAGSLATTAATVSFQGVAGYSFTTYTPGSGWTEDLDATLFGQSRSDASGTLDPVVTFSGTMDWVTCAASFKESGGGGGGGAVSSILLMGVGK